MSKEKILVVEDDKDLARLIHDNFEKEGFRVICAHDAETALKLVAKVKPDLIILDIMLPKMDGLEFLRAIRPRVDVPIILLSAKRGEMDRIRGLKQGADDYMVKPFFIGELQARVVGHLRCHANRGASGESKESITVGGIAIDFERHEILIRGKSVYFAPKEFAILNLLIEANGKVVSRSRMLDMIWGRDKYMETDTRTIDQHILRLRRKLGPESGRVTTITNFGHQIRMN